ncbi:DUF2267 domain-containing protein [Egbenema bharatensis]|uniref:DUF2267 domain-containing protein n=1 Tax=Egbenema bharatensis TaxID=3463334 RepID=UPI003A86054F
MAAANTGSQPPIANHESSDDRSFLEKVMRQAGLIDPYDARDITEVVFRCMRDLMTTEASDRVADELPNAEVLKSAEAKSLQIGVDDLWQDTNPLVSFLSRIRPPLHGSGFWRFDADRFVFRVANEASVPRNLDPERVIQAVFSATKDELSEERVEEVARWLPDRVRQIWEQA